MRTLFAALASFAILSSSALRADDAPKESLADRARNYLGWFHGFWLGKHGIIPNLDAGALVSASAGAHLVDDLVTGLEADEPERCGNAAEFFAGYCVLRLHCERDLAHFGADDSPSGTKPASAADTLIAERVAQGLGRPRDRIAAGLERRLLHEQPAIRVSAATALLCLKPTHVAARTVLRSAARAENPDLRADACLRWGHLGLDDPELPALVRSALKARQSHVRLAALELVLRHGPRMKSAVPQLVKIVGSGDSAAMGQVTPVGMSGPPGTQNVALMALAAMGPAAADAVPVLVAQLPRANDERLAELCQCLASIGPPAAAAVPVLGERLTARSPQVSCSIAAAILRIRPEHKSALEVLVKELGSPRITHRRLAAWNLRSARLPGAVAVPLLVPSLKDADEEVRILAAQALGATGSESAQSKLQQPPSPMLVSSLVALLADPQQDAPVARAAAGALAALGPASVPHLSDIVKNSAGSGREEAVFALGLLGEKAQPAVATLVMALQDSDASLRCAAAVALGRVGVAAHPAAPHLVKPSLGREKPAEDAGEEFLVLAGWALERVSPVATARK